MFELVYSKKQHLKNKKTQKIVNLDISETNDWKTIGQVNDAIYSEMLKSMLVI